jgi:hypothetical protein
MRLPLAVLVACLACCGVASAGPGLILGVADDDLKWTEDTKEVVLDQQAVGFKAVRVTLAWQQGQTRLDDEGRTYMRRAQAAVKLGHRVVIGVFGDPAGPPVQPESRTQYCAYVVDALSRAKNVNDVVIWNEANSALFWRPQQGAAAAYEALLAECYDTLHRYRRTVNVITSTSPHEDLAGSCAPPGTPTARAAGRRRSSTRWATTRIPRRRASRPTPRTRPRRSTRATTPA